MPVVLNRGDLLRDYADLSPQTTRELDAASGPLTGFVVQASSGSSGAPLILRRTRRDVADIAQRVLARLRARVGFVPSRIALIGGISHVEAATHLSLPGLSLCSFELDALDALVAFDPVALSCFPNVIRDLVGPASLRLPSLKVIKLGGETVFARDVEEIFERFPEVLVVEQYGSTELPALATRTFDRRDFAGAAGDLRRLPYELHTERFTFALPAVDGWHPIIAEDRFADLLVRLPFYDTGDEGLFVQGELVSVRRANDSAARFEPLWDELRARGCRNIQIDPKTQTVRVSGSPQVEHAFHEGVRYRLIDEAPVRLASNKLPMVWSS